MKLVKAILILCALVAINTACKKLEPGKEYEVTDGKNYASFDGKKWFADGTANKIVKYSNTGYILTLSDRYAKKQITIEFFGDSTGSYWLKGKNSALVIDNETNTEHVTHNDDSHDSSLNLTKFDLNSRLASGSFKLRLWDRVDTVTAAKDMYVENGAFEDIKIEIKQ